MLSWLALGVCALLIVVSGVQLAKYADCISEKTGLGRTWVGVLLLASITSLPELISAISAVTVNDLPDIAVGSIAGSNMFNLVIVSLVDAAAGSIPLSRQVHEGHILSASFGSLLCALVCLNILASRFIPTVGWIGAGSLVFLALYLVAMRSVFDHERKRIAQFVAEVAAEAEEQYGEISTLKAWTMLTLNAAVVVGAAMFLPSIGDRIAVDTGLGDTFVGNFFLAAVTSMPEVVVALAAVRLGALDMAVGNVLGSNLFNIGVLGLADCFYLRGPLLSSASHNNVISLTSAIAMTAVAVAGLSYRSEKKRLLLAWDALGILVLYVGSAGLLYVMR
jgi:cation:H+ antiporter